VKELRPAAGCARESAFFAATRGLCNTCGSLVEAKIVFRSGKVWLEKLCSRHGPTEALVCSDVDWYRRSLSFVKPGTPPEARAVPAYSGCPASCGLCPEHQQHTCLPVLEITDRCDLDCPICLVGRRGGRDLSVKQVKGILDGLVRCEGRLNMLNLSGGEPTLHPDFLRIVDAVRRPEIGIVSVSTHGLALLRNPDLIRELRDRDVVISLQFDGFRPETYGILRGRRDLAGLKARLLERLLDAGARLSLTVTLARGVNEGELGGILDLLFRHDRIISLMVQPVAHTGHASKRFPGDPMQAVTIPDVVRLLAGASGGVLEERDFTPLPCSHPSCFALTYLLRTEEGGLVPLPRILEPEGYLEIIKNQALLNTDADTLGRIRDSLYTLWSSDGVVPDREAVLGTVRKILLELGRPGREAGHRELLDLGVRHVKSIFIHHFMDRYTFDLSRAMKCCHHYPQADGRLLPACVRNNINLV